MDFRPGATTGRALLAKVLFAVDHQLQRQNGVFCYSDDPACILRVSLARLEHTVKLANEVELPAGTAVAKLHLWNEHLPVISPNSISWGARMKRGFHHSLRLLQRYLANRADCADVAAVEANPPFATAAGTGQVVRVCGTCGFVPSRQCEAGFLSHLHRFGENVLISLFVLALNPVALRRSSLFRVRTPMFLLRSELDERFGTDNKRALPPVGLSA